MMFTMWEIQAAMVEWHVLEMLLILTKIETDEFLKRQRTNTLHKPARLRYCTRPYKTAGIDQQWQADLVGMIPYEGVNDGYRYMLTVIDLQYLVFRMDGTRLVTPSFWTFRNLVQLLAPCLITYPTLKSEYKHQASKCHLPDALMNLAWLGVFMAVLSMTGFDQALLRWYTWIFNDSSHYYIKVLHCLNKTTTLQQ